MDNEIFDVIVLGGGPGGYYATIRLAQRGLRVLCVEREEVGGVCLNWGCIPSKALITASERWHQVRSSAFMGIHVGDARFDMAEAQRWTRGIVQHHTHGVEGLMRAQGATLVRGEAELVAPNRVAVRRTDGSQAMYGASRGVVIATGARPSAPRGFEPNGSTILSAKEAVRLTTVPKRLAVLGGGVIGVELGTLYQKLGAELTIIEAMPRILSTVDADLVRVVERRLTKRGARILTGARATGVRESGGEIVLEGSVGEQPFSVNADALLVAVGFKPNTESLHAAELGLSLDERGHVRTDEACRTNLPGVYAIGDVSGPPYLAHKAFKEAEVVADALCGKPAARDYRALPNAIFSDPEIAVSGVGEEEAKRTLSSVSVGRFPLAALGKAHALGDAEGFLKVIASEGRVVGITAVGPHVTELLGEAGLALETAATVEDLALTIHPHPTMSEALREAAEVLLGQPIHVQAPKRAAINLTSPESSQVGASAGRTYP